MATEAVDGIFNFTKPVIMVFPHLFEPRKFKPRAGRKEVGEPKFDAQFIFKPDHPDFAAYKARALAIAKAKWPGKDLAAEYKAGALKMPWGDGEKAADRYVKKLTDAGKSDDGKSNFQRGHLFIKASSKYQPRLSFVDGGRIVELTDASQFAAHKSKFYSGVNVFAQVNLVAYDAVGDDGKDGVTAYLNMVLSLNKGDRIGSSGPSASEVFKDYIGHTSTEDPTGGLEDEIPF